jgi:uncharacterized protein (TIGR03435 family)
MPRALTSVGFVVLFSGVVFGQTGIIVSGTSAPAFEAADVHVSAKSRMPYMAAGGLRGTRYLVRQATLVDLISLAYDIDNDKILGGPRWLDTDRFDVSARAPSGSTPEQAKLMLQTLLAERFSLKLHKDSKELSGLVLSMGSGKPSRDVYLAIEFSQQVKAVDSSERDDRGGIGYDGHRPSRSSVRRSSSNSAIP